MVEGVGDVLEAVEDFDRTDVPGTLAVTIEDPGGYSIYHEFPGASDSGFRSLVQEPDLRLTDPSGDEVQLHPYTSLVTYAWGTIEGRGLYTFRAEAPGTYELEADGQEGTSIAVGRGLGDIGQEALLGLFGGVMGGLLVAGLSIAAASILAVCVGVARSRNRRRLLPPPPRYTGWAPPPTWSHHSPTWPTPVGPSPARRDAQPQTRLPTGTKWVAPASPPANGRRDAPLPWSRPAETAVSQPGDPPSLRSPADWSRSDAEIPWDPDSL